MIETVAANRVRAVVTQSLLDEHTVVLAWPNFRRWISAADATAFVEALGGHAGIYPDPGAPSLPVRDPKDIYRVALAESTDATIITGEADLFDVNLTIRVFTPAGFLKHITSQDPP